MKTLIEVNLQYEALHHWPDAAEKLPEVAFLSSPHRHMFHITLQREVSHSDRDIEIIMFKRRVLHDLETEWLGNFGPMSCEDIAETLLKEYQCEMVKVLEDGENGAVVYK